MSHPGLEPSATHSIDVETLVVSRTNDVLSLLFDVIKTDAGSTLKQKDYLKGFYIHFEVYWRRLSSIPRTDTNANSVLIAGSVSVAVT